MDEMAHLAHSGCATLFAKQAEIIGSFYPLTGKA